ncbi:hypothetical protein IJH02_00350 [Candidatus Saccharibacteria bacterium]|nr:hypothetical protein [Candidatus Saccharibacteria bacterium]
MDWQIIVVLIGIGLVFGLFGGLVKNEAWSLTFRWPSFIAAIGAAALIAIAIFPECRLYSVAIALFIPIARAIIVILSLLIPDSKDGVPERLPNWFDGVMYEAISLGIAIPLIVIVQGLIDLGSSIANTFV